MPLLIQGRYLYRAGISIWPQIQDRGRLAQ